jgi:hypothetical protein
MKKVWFVLGSVVLLLLPLAYMLHGQAGGFATGGAVSTVAGKSGTVVLGEGDITNLTTDLAAKAPSTSPSFGGTVGSTGTIQSTVAGAATVLNNAASTNFKFDEFTNTGNTGFYWGLESSVGGAFFTGSNAYESILYTPSNNLFINTPVLRVSGPITSAGGAVATVVATDDRVTQSATVNQFTLYAVGSSGTGAYRFQSELACTASDASGATVQTSATWVQHALTFTVTSGVLALSSTAVQNQNHFLLFADNSTNVTLTITVTGVPTTGRFDIHTRLIKE